MAPQAGLLYVIPLTLTVVDSNATRAAGRLDEPATWALLVGSLATGKGDAHATLNG